MRNNEFLKIKVKDGNFQFEMFQYRGAKKRPRRWQLNFPVAHLVNRHTQKSQVEFLTNAVWRVQLGCGSYFRGELDAKKLS